MQVLILLLILSSVSFDLCNGKHRIYKGVTTLINKHPHQVGLLTKLDFGSLLLCGGSIVNNNTIITAAHCIEDDLALNAYTVRIGSTNLYKGEEFKIMKIIKHPDYNLFTLTNDIAILKLEKSLIYNDSIKPIELQPKNKEIPAGTKALTSGWGSINLLRLKIPNELQELEVVVLDEKICKFYSKYQASKKICAQNKGKSVCKGDSGGPLIVNGKLVGITSHVIANCEGRFPYFFTKVASVRDFIDQNM